MVFSTTNYSLIPLEMMACGLPVVELDMPSTRAVFTHDVATLATPDPTSIAAAVAKLLSDPEKRTSQIKAGLRFTQNLDWRASARLVESAIHERLIEIGTKTVSPAEIVKPHRIQSRKASVFIPTLNAGPNFKSLLERLDRQDTTFDYDVLVIDSGSEMVLLTRSVRAEVVNFVYMRFRILSFSMDGHGILVSV